MNATAHKIPAQHEQLGVWTQDPEAAAILADCAANPPASRVHVVQYHQTADVTHHYTGKRVQKLRVIRARYQDEALLIGDRRERFAGKRHPDQYAEFNANCVTVDEAIAAECARPRALTGVVK